MRRAATALGLALGLALGSGTARADKPDATLIAAQPAQKVDPKTAQPQPKVAPADVPRPVKSEPSTEPHAEVSAAPAFLPPPPVLPDTGTFDWLLVDLARPTDGKARGLTTSSASVALSAQTPLLSPQVKSGDVMLLRGPAMNATVGSVPAGSSIFGFLAPNHADVDSLKLHEVGKLVVEPDGLLQRTGRHLLGTGKFRDVVLDGVGAMITTGLIARLGTARAQGLLGFDPSTHVKLFHDKLDQRVAFHCDSKFKNAGVDLSTQYHLLHVSAPQLSPWLADGYLEGGVTVQRGLGPGVIPVRWGKLHLVNGHFDGGVGLYDPPTGPPSLTLDGVAQLSKYRLHLAMSRENGTGHLGATTTVITQAGPLQTGVFFGGRRTDPGAADRGFTAGVIAMAVF